MIMIMMMMVVVAVVDVEMKINLTGQTTLRCSAGHLMVCQQKNRKENLIFYSFHTDNFSYSSDKDNFSGPNNCV